MPLYEYKCVNGHRFEDFNSVEKRMKKKCPECGIMGTKIMSIPHFDYYNMGVQDGLPTALDKWDKMHRQMARRKSED